MNMPAVAIDFEATDATDEAEATEIGYCAVGFANNGVLNPLEQAKSVRCKPERAISYGAMAVTGICPEDLISALCHKPLVRDLMPTGTAYVIGHNIDYDLQVAKNAGVDTSQYKSICTLAIARHLYPEADHKLTALLYMLDYDYAREHAQNSHSAAFDVRFCIRLLRIFCREAGITDMADLHAFSEMARTPKIMSFGKHKGSSLMELASTKKGRGYFFWLLCNVDRNPYLIKECHRLLAGTSLECIKGNKYYLKGNLYTIGQFTDTKKLIVSNGADEHVLIIENASKIALEVVDSSRENAIFKPA